MKNQLSLNDFSYELPDERIAHFPLKERNNSKMLFYDGQVTDYFFRDLVDLVPSGSLLVFNDTRVIPARLILYKNSGAQIEIFLTEPAFPSADVQLAMASSGPVQWKCMIGNLKKWKDGQVLQAQLGDLTLEARLVDRQNQRVELSWSGENTLASVLDIAGRTPLPPYIRRKDEPSDKERYQTVYSCNPGAVAAPTAGLHFTDDMLLKLKKKGVECAYVTLHVSAGTFQPVKHSNVLEHEMHNEQLVVPAETIKMVAKTKGPIIPVGTTSLRTLESLYWYGVRLHMEGANTPFFIPKTYPYNHPEHLLPPVKQAMKNIEDQVKQSGTDFLTGSTEIFITPGYKFKLTDALITNFHMPKSTLIMLIAAFIGQDWRKIYTHALEHDYRFLSYGDSSFIRPKG